MTAPTVARRRGLTLAELAAREQEQVKAGAAACGKQCDGGCHGPLTCVRTAHPHDPHADMGVDDRHGQPRPRGNVTPHVGLDPSGVLVQWTCVPGDHDGLTAIERAAQTIALKADATRALFNSIDPQLLVQLLREGGHL